MGLLLLIGLALALPPDQPVHGFVRDRGSTIYGQSIHRPDQSLNISDGRIIALDYKGSVGACEQAALNDTQYYSFVWYNSSSGDKEWRGACFARTDRAYLPYTNASTIAVSGRKVLGCRDAADCHLSGT